MIYFNFIMMKQWRVRATRGFSSSVHLSWLLIRRIILFIYHTIYINYILGCCYGFDMWNPVQFDEGCVVPLNVSWTAMRQYFIIFFVYFLGKKSSIRFFTKIFTSTSRALPVVGYKVVAAGSECMNNRWESEFVAIVLSYCVGRNVFHSVLK